jgi:outer membrane protein TolC
MSLMIKFTPLLRASLVASLLVGLVFFKAERVLAVESSQGPTSGLTLEQAVEEGKSNSPILQRAQAAAQAAEWKRVEALSGFLPNIGASAAHYFSQKYLLTTLNFPPFGLVTIPGITPASVGSINASLPLFDGFQNINHYAAANEESQAAQFDAGWAAFRIEQDIRLKFYQAIAAAKLANVAEENVKTIEDHLKNTQALRRGGVSTNFDVLRTEVQLSDALSDRVQAQDNVAITRQILNEALGLEKDDRSLVGDLPTPQPGLVDGLTLTNNDDRLDVKALEARERASHKQSVADSVFWVPRVSLVGSYTYYNNLTNSFTDTDSYRNSYQFGVLATWNIFDGISSIARSKESQYHAEEASRTLKISQLKVPTDFEANRRRYNYSTALYHSRLVNVERAQESVRLASVGYKAGVRINSEVLDSQLELFRARAGVVSAQLAASESLINLELTTGKRILR